MEVESGEENETSDNAHALKQSKVKV